MILRKNIANVMRSINIFIKLDVSALKVSNSLKLLHLRAGECHDETQAFLEIRYPAATVLLDLSANEHCIEEVAILLR
jgi:hypothetical protein